MAQTGYKRFLNRRKWQTDFSAPYSEPASYDTTLSGTHSFRFSVYLESTATINLFLDTPGFTSPTISCTFSYSAAGSEQTYDVTLPAVAAGNYNFRLKVSPTQSYNAKYLAGSFEPNTTTGGDGPYFAPVWDPGTCAVNGTQALAAPTLTLTYTQTATVVSWTQVTSSTGYTVDKSLDGVAWSGMGTIDPNFFVIYDTDFLPNTSYYYRIKAVGNGSNYLDSAYGLAGMLTGAKQLDGPALSVVGVSSTSVSLSWVDVQNESYYQLSRSLAFEGPYALVATFSAGSTSHTDSGLVTNTRYFYRMYSAGDGADYLDSEYAYANGRTT